MAITGTRDVVVLGYQQEPYLRFTAAGVFRDQRSPATYLNDDRLGKVVVPATADPKAPPQWTKVAAGTSYQWHDHRIHWMGTTPPAAIRNHPGRARRMFTRTVPLIVAGAAGKIDGELDYRPRTTHRQPLARPVAGRRRRAAR